MGTLSFCAFEKSPNCKLLNSCEFYGIAASGVTGKLCWKSGLVLPEGITQPNGKNWVGMKSFSKSSRNFSVPFFKIINKAKPFLGGDEQR